MKPRTEKRDERVMRFFTPQRFMRFNSADEDEADRANAEWEKVLVEYRRHLHRIRAQIPAEAKALAEMCLHDAELLNPERAVDPLFRIQFEPPGQQARSFGPAILPLKQNGDLVTLIYLVSGAVQAHQPVRHWPFSKRRPHWLFDEIDLGSDRCGPFVHRVLISDGRVLEIPFVSVSIHKTPLSPPGDELARRSA